MQVQTVAILPTDVVHKLMLSLHEIFAGLCHNDLDELKMINLNNDKIFRRSE